MFGLIRLFKPSKIRVKIDKSIYNNKSIYSFIDFYKETGIETYMNKVISESGEKQFNMYNMICNSKTLESIHELVKNNVSKSKKGIYKMLKDEKKSVAVALDYLMYSPRTDNKVSDDMIIILKENNKDYRKYQGR